jgi:sporulation protein YlmC with PRC-barrel domain
MPRPIAVVTVIALCSWLLAPEGWAQRGRESGPAASSPSVWYASTLLGAAVKTPQGETLGTITDLVIDPQDGRPTMVVISRGGFLGLGASYIIMPWWEVLPASDGTGAAVVQQLEEGEQAAR